MTTLSGRYQIIRQLGGGGFAMTFLARDTMQPSQPLCVVKQLRPHHTELRVVELFEKEAAILEKLGKHPQIPRLLAHFKEDDNLYIVQQFIQGQDLSKEILPGKQRSEDYVTNLLQEVLEILCFVHHQGVIHRDIKPHNLMRRHEDGKIFLIDFGAVKEIGSVTENSRGELTSTVIIGTPSYMPNEQKNGKPCLGSDMYALGLTAIQALTGILPIDLPEDPLTGEILWQDKVKISNHLTNILTKMVRRHHSLRYLCAQEALQALTTPTPPLLQWSRRRVIQTLGFAGAGFIAAVLGENISQRGAKTKVLALQSFQFQVVSVDIQGNITNRRLGQANFFTEDLGNGVTLDMVAIPSGKLVMGSLPREQQRLANEDPQHTVTIPSFFMGKFAVTQEQYQAIMGNNPSNFTGARRPVEKVTWDNATEFCSKISYITGKNYRLPSEAEWEYAARAGTTTPFHFGETITTDLANYDGHYTYGLEPKGEYRRETTDVGTFPPNAFGLYDMHGNIWEWCQDNWHNNYVGAPNDGSVWTNENDLDSRLRRGGSWYIYPWVSRSAYRSRYLFNSRNDDVGFRVVVSGDIGLGG
ncbi:bifunctional serine/threonine-protein kinase/formylglycine-generating enzyme family protein [Aetokthonos hydrillicola]|uniref:bifunctional serine/threonine-protein kinase/formylglycine-generating enzyme family protein n=1 Tax=Aetokthonos hydrillicola TaxID=1550245 RepID=UPI0028778839|nr:bifunctional serine/threonine-protein kinase/formylglycine-generating enzyme family protein [Aetokthonos hydrillicola]